MLMLSLLGIYSTHLVLEVVNISIIAYLSVIMIGLVTVVVHHIPLGMNVWVEVIWLMSPTCIMVVLLLRAIMIQYYSDECIMIMDGITVVGNQWFWVWGLDVESIYVYLIRERASLLGDLRIVGTIQSILIPVGSTILLTCSAADVIHSFTIPVLGCKTDLVPGRSNVITLVASMSGILYGQCSEICGTLHGFMPISILSV
uniref:cytochrome-c oxidase n=1 Tax=Sulcionema specki TaxID=2016126 RepID=A0A6G5ZU06_9EUGL|nr:cytochrome c oxidase subunit 2 [Sulcionema specki]